MESPESMTLTFYISSAICAQADFDFLTCSLFFSIPAGKFPWNDERSVHRDFIYNTCGTLVMTVIHSTNQDRVDWVATKAQISYSILSFWSCCSSLKFRAFLPNQVKNRRSQGDWGESWRNSPSLRMLQPVHYPASRVSFDLPRSYIGKDRSDSASRVLAFPLPFPLFRFRFRIPDSMFLCCRELKTKIETNKSEILL